MTPRSLVRRPLQVGGLLLATAALGTAVAPAALAMVDPTTPVDHTPEQAPVAGPRVLTSSPISYLGSPDARVQFGVGKVQIYVAPSADVDAPEEENLSGAQVEVSLPDPTSDTGAQVHITCTTISTGLCVFPDDTPGLVGGLLPVGGRQTLTVQQTTAPASQKFTLPTPENAVVHGVGGFVFPLEFPLDDTDTNTADVAPPAGVPTVVQADQRDIDPGPDDVIGTITFFDPLATLSAGQPGTVVVPPAPAAAADTTALAAPVVPVVADASAVPATATTATATAPALAVTGADVVPVAAVGGGLLVAGAAGLVLARRRAPR